MRRSVRENVSPVVSAKKIFIVRVMENVLNQNNVVQTEMKNIDHVVLIVLQHVINDIKHVIECVLKALSVKLVTFANTIVYTPVVLDHINAEFKMSSHFFPFLRFFQINRDLFSLDFLIGKSEKTFD